MAYDDVEVLRVTFHPPLHLQRQIWILDILRRENIQSVLDIGCGEGALLQCLTAPSRTLPPTTSLPATSPFAIGPNAEHHADLYLKAIHGLDPHTPDLEFAILGTEPTHPDKPPYTGYERWKRREARWMRLEVSIWEGGFEAINEEAFGKDRIDAFVASEVIEHLTPELFPLFAPVLLGHYRPRLLLLTTPNYNFNQRFSRPGEIAPTGYPDPTGRTDRVFRHHDHKFEWTTEEWTKYCREVASEFGYSVEIGGVGLAVEPDPWKREASLGFASQVATFRRDDSKKPAGGRLSSSTPNLSALMQRPVLRVKHLHLPHPLSEEELDLPSIADEVREAVKDVMNDSKEGSMTFNELWKHGKISLKCRGDIGALVHAFEAPDFDLDMWAVEDEAKAWETKVIWKKFVMAADSLEVSESEALQGHTWSGDDITVEEDVTSTDDSFSPGFVLPENGNNEAEEAKLASCSWGWTSESGQTHWGWNDTNAEACEMLSGSPWSGSV